MQYFFSCKVAKHEENIYDKKDSIPLVEQIKKHTGCCRLYNTENAQRMQLVKQNQKRSRYYETFTD